jgi:hypothetical protein
VATIIRSDFYDAIATHRVKGFEVTSPAETVFTLASTLDLRALSATLDDVLLTGKATVGEFTPIFDRVVGRRARGAGRLRRLIEERHPDEYGSIPRISSVFSRTAGYHRPHGSFR